MTHQVSLVVLLVALILAGCEGAEGPVGPEGPEGPRGPQGPAGAANVQTFTFTLNDADFSTGQEVEEYYHPTDLITDDVVDAGVVLAYTDLGTSGQAWFSMPLVVPTSGTTVVLSFAYEFETAAILILKETTTDQFASAFDGNRVKVVVIPPGSVTSTTKAGLDLTDYRAVARYYGLE